MSVMIPWYQLASPPRACGCTLGRNGRCCQDQRMDYQEFGYVPAPSHFWDMPTYPTPRYARMKPRIRVKAGREVVP